MCGLWTHLFVDADPQNFSDPWTGSRSVARENRRTRTDADLVSLIFWPRIFIFW